MFGEDLPGKPFGGVSLRPALSLPALGYLFVTSGLKFAKLRAMMFLAQLQLKTFLPSFFPLPSQSTLEKLLREALTPWVSGRNHGLCQGTAPTWLRTYPAPVAAPDPAALLTSEL